ncbi:MAG: heat-inducible transcriptional repressor HrcA [Synergistaceae bacterium]|jgi:heat-inducible transcriptional repressor|nr:heat-inducible transcriptional repressor HrcA [Synergistaceae bacterium]
MLTERQLEVLLSVVHEFIESGEQVGSRTLSKRYLKGRSAATIRNEMADLEEMGYLMQPHTSAGRVPTTMAYRIFVDTVLQRRPRGEQGRGTWMVRLREHRDGLRGALGSASELLSQLSSYVGMAAVTQLKQARLNKIDFVRVDTSHFLLLVILEGGVVHHRVVNMPYDLSQDALEDLARKINTLSGYEWKEVSEALQSYIFKGLGKYTDSCRKALDELDALLAGERTTLFTGSLANLFDIPDFQDIVRFRALFSVLEQEGELAKLLAQYGKKDGIGVIIGEENQVPELEDCSVVFSSSSTEGARTMLGVIGPKRMNYERVIAALDRVLCDIDMDGLTDNPDGEGDGHDER